MTFLTPLISEQNFQNSLFGLNKDTPFISFPNSDFNQSENLYLNTCTGQKISSLYNLSNPISKLFNIADAQEIKIENTYINKIKELENKVSDQNAEILNSQEMIIQNNIKFSTLKEADEKNIQELQDKNSIQLTEIKNLKETIIQNNNHFFKIKKSDQKKIKGLQDKIIIKDKEILNLKKINPHLIWIVFTIALVAFTIGLIAFPSILFTVYLFITHFIKMYF